MCGIAGIVAPGAGRFEPELRRMVEALKHRGPDARDVHLFDACALGHARLSIIDVAGSPQPMMAADGRGAVVFNGEIYGYKEVRRRHPEYPFRTEGDTEVLLALYRRHETAMLRHLPGMFAFAIWDDARQTLFCGRDRFGEKPFYYAAGSGGEFVFASEIKAILASNLVRPALRPAGLRHYLRKGYSHPAGTIFQGIQSLPPAHGLVYRAGRVTIERYWELPPMDDRLTMEAAAAEFRHLFERSVSRQLVADVPVGMFLSGGLDSSTIVAVASRLHPRCKTFSFGFGKSINELPFARQIAERYGTEHTELSDAGENIASLLGLMQDIFDEPIGDSANIPTYLLSKLSRRDITVALAGEGSDELTCGYDFWYRPLFNFERARRLPGMVWPLIRAASAACKVFGRKLPRSLAQLWEGYFMTRHYGSALEAHEARGDVFSAEELDAFGLPDEGPPRRLQAPGTSGLDSVCRADLQEYLPGDILTKTDRASMASGLEIRCPFLDVDFASFCITLPARLKIDARTEKLVLRAAFADAWTPAIRKRTKQGFGAPMGDWLKRPEMKELKGDLFNHSQAKIFRYLPAKSVAPHLQKDDYKTWLLLVLALWLEKRAL